MITSSQMQQLEKQAVQEGISIEQLMENAGRKVFEVVEEKFELSNSSVIIFAGHGNNGGDGFVAARHFKELYPVTVLFFGNPESLSEESRLNYDKIKDEINIIQIENKEDLKFKFQPKNLLLIDAMLGTGIKGEIREPISSGIDLFNSLSGTKIAVDIPTGINPDTGERADKFCQVDLIVCFHDLKAGLKELQEKTIIVDIGIDKEKIISLDENLKIYKS